MGEMIELVLQMIGAWMVGWYLGKLSVLVIFKMIELKRKYQNEKTKY
ncbi:hypothetical protein [Facklamia lactis]|nr:hypothetical protein [Facklamia lactis]MBG9980463.1 hypothetical protein [Facklamia lactis]